MSNGDSWNADDCRHPSRNCDSVASSALDDLSKRVLIGVLPVRAVSVSILERYKSATQSKEVPISKDRHLNN